MFKILRRNSFQVDGHHFIKSLWISYARELESSLASNDENQLSVSFDLMINRVWKKLKNKVCKMKKEIQDGTSIFFIGFSWGGEKTSSPATFLQVTQLHCYSGVLKCCAPDLAVLPAVKGLHVDFAWNPASLRRTKPAAR